MTSEHTIRLRGGWEWHDRPDAAPARVALPLARRPAGGGPVRLVRRFQSPPIDPARESLWLRLEAVPGLLAVSLNGRDLGGTPPAEGPLLLPLVDARPAGNRLELLVGAPPGEAEAPEAPWGDVALVVRGGGRDA